MANLNGFDANEVEPQGDFEPIPASKYVCAVVESEMKPTKSGTGQFLEFTLQVLEGEYTGRQLWARLNLDNPNAKAVQIARGQLSALCRSVGVLTPQDSSQLHNLPLSVRVVQKLRDDNGEITNEVKGFSKREVPAVQAPADSGAAPWAQG
jgi:hypothetical protein